MAFSCFVGWVAILAEGALDQNAAAGGYVFPQGPVDGQLSRTFSTSS